MKRIFTLSLLCFLVSPIHCSLSVSPNLHDQAHEWAQEAILLHQNEVQLIANFLYCGSEVTHADTLMRSLVGPFMLMTKK